MVVIRNVCSKRHEEGPVVFIFPDDIWYTSVTLEDVPRIIDRHLVRDLAEKDHG